MNKMDWERTRAILRTTNTIHTAALHERGMIAFESFQAWERQLGRWRAQVEKRDGLARLDSNHMVSKWWWEGYCAEWDGKS